ncbi:MAG: carbonic anhydrase family protein [Gammaproteobacteria bacterium]|nr:carbonic anhydrase family protein [Gammaproteobacteria bacterium]
MKYTVAALFLSTLSATALAGAGTNWEYSGKHGTENWGELSPKFTTCSTGVNQSPIDISGAIESQLPPLGIDYSASRANVLNNGHTIQVNIDGNNTFSNDSGQFKLLQFHFHAPSENTINGQSFPMEAHFVHADSEGRLAVIGVMFKQGNINQDLEKIWRKMPNEAGATASLESVLKSSVLMPSTKDYFRFNGSLTTPPCSEGVRWFVLKDPIEASPSQIKQFRKMMHGNTNRPVQPINARVILQ